MPSEPVPPAPPRPFRCPYCKDGYIRVERERDGIIDAVRIECPTCGRSGNAAEAAA